MCISPIRCSVRGLTLSQRRALSPISTSVGTSRGLAEFYRKLGRFCRVVLFDKRGTGLSDHVGNLPGMDERMDDLRAVMDAAGVERASLLGISEGGSLAALFAASHPERTHSLILYGAFTCSRHWIPSDEAFDRLIKYIDNAWGSGKGLPLFAPSKADDAALRQWWGKFERLGASPSAAIALMRMNRQIDISAILHSIKVPTLVLHVSKDALVSLDGGRELAAGIPGARLVELPGTDHLFFLEASDRILAETEEFLTGSRSTTVVDRVLATVVFTDIVESTKRAEATGDRAWRDLLDAHNKTVRRELSASGEKRLSRWAMVSSRLSTGRRGQFTARPPFAIHSPRSAFRSGSASIPARSSWRKPTSAASPFTLPRGWLTWERPATCSSRAPSRTWLPARESILRTSARTR